MLKLSTLAVFSVISSKRELIHPYFSLLLQYLAYLELKYHYPKTTVLYFFPHTLKLEDTCAPPCPLVILKFNRLPDQQNMKHHARPQSSLYLPWQPPTPIELCVLKSICPSLSPPRASCEFHGSFWVPQTAAICVCKLDTRKYSC